MNTSASLRYRATPMNALAAVSALALVATLAWSAMHPETLSFSARGVASQRFDSDTASIPVVSAAGATSSTPLGDAVIAQFATRYQELSSQGAASADTVAQQAADIVPQVSYANYSAADVATDPDTSLKAVIRYRGDMRVALAPLLQSTTPEFEIYARYIDTGDQQYLDQLSKVAADYRTALSLALKVKVPSDAVSYHVGVLNAMSGFASALDALVNNAKDPIASVALLRTYNAAEAQMFTSFNSLGQYAAHKTL